MSFLNDAINAALRNHNVPQVGTSGSSSVADALRSLLAPKAHQAGLSAEDTHVEPDALQELLTRLEHGGYGDIVRSWIGAGQNEPIEPAHVDAALGPNVAELSHTSGIPRETLVQELARLLPSVIDRLTPQGKLPETVAITTPPRP
jgi:uncharacterized protein YidB (DUF937 family)